MSINPQFFFSAPAEVVRVTKHNLQEVAEWCGGRVAETPSKKDPKKMSPYVWVPTPPRTRLTWAFIGMYVTKRLIVGVDGEIQESWQVFRRDYFNANFFENPDAAVKGTWEPHFKALGRKTTKATKEPDEVPVNEVKQMAAAMGLTQRDVMDEGGNPVILAATRESAPFANPDRIDTVNPLIVETEDGPVPAEEALAPQTNEGVDELYTDDYLESLDNHALIALVHAGKIELNQARKARGLKPIEEVALPPTNESDGETIMLQGTEDFDGDTEVTIVIPNEED